MIDLTSNKFDMDSAKMHKCYLKERQPPDELTWRLGTAASYHDYNKQIYIPETTRLVTLDQRRRTTLIKRRIINPRIISLVIIAYIINTTNQSLMTALIEGAQSSIRNYSTNDINDMSIYVDKNDNAHHHSYHSLSSHNDNKVMKSSSLIQIVSASPAPEPAAASARSSHRVPPINGSIFGKRSVTGLSSNRQPKISAQEEEEFKESTVSKSGAAIYEDIITDIIEDFLAKNDKGEHWSLI